MLPSSCRRALPHLSHPCSCPPPPPPAQYDGEKADVWSCGVALYTMLVGTYPFRDLQDPASCRKMVQVRAM